MATEAEPAETDGEVTAGKRERKRSYGPSFLQRYALALVWALVVLIFIALEPDTYASTANAQIIFGSQAVLLVLALGLIIPLTAGEFDLSIASMLTLSAMLVAYLNVNQGLPILLAIAIALGVGVLVGLINGLLVVALDLDSFIVTLGMGTVLIGFVAWISGSQTISGIDFTLIDWVINYRILGVSLSFWYGLLICIGLWYVYRYTPIGRRLLFVGRGRDVARLSGLRVNRIRVGALVASSTFAALAGVLYSGSIGGADPTSGQGFLLPAFAAAYLGGTAISPGRFNPWGTFIAVYFLVSGVTGLQLLGAQDFVQQLFYGGALLIAVAAAEIVRRRRKLSR